jgi:hypothetical protein
MIVPTLPTPGASNNTWGTDLNAGITALANYEIFAYKTADESVTSSVVAQDDDHLFFTVVASSIYSLSWSLITDGAAAGDIQYTFTAPAGATLTWQSCGLNPTDATNVASTNWDLPNLAAVATHGTLAAGTNTRINGSGLLIVAGTAGTLKLRWMQNVSNATATKVKTGSWLSARRMA